MLLDGHTRGTHAHEQKWSSVLQMGKAKFWSFAFNMFVRGAKLKQSIHVSIKIQQL